MRRPKSVCVILSRNFGEIYLSFHFFSAILRSDWEREWIFAFVNIFIIHLFRLTALVFFFCFFFLNAFHKRFLFTYIFKVKLPVNLLGHVILRLRVRGRRENFVFQTDRIFVSYRTQSSRIARKVRTNARSSNAQTKRLKRHVSRTLHAECLSFCINIIYMCFVFTAAREYARCTWRRRRFFLILLTFFRHDRKGEFGIFVEKVR